MSVEIIHPLLESRWPEFLLQHPDASVFHSRSWLLALQRTYGYEPQAICTIDKNSMLSAAIVFCRVQSWLTGQRLVSLPFSDHCAPLASTPVLLAEMLAELRKRATREQSKFVELRPLHPLHQLAPDWLPAQQFRLHMLSLEAPLEIILSRMHKSNIKRKLQRAEREGLVFRNGRSNEMIESFYRLLIQTRRRHKVLPQPLSWFKNLAAAFGDGFTIRMASYNQRPIAAIVTLEFKDTLVYKYGASDDTVHNLGGMPALFWRTVVEAKAAGLRKLDLGRSDLNAHGLVSFKQHLGAECLELGYWRAYGKQPHVQPRSPRIPFSKSVFTLAPDSLLAAAGSLLYRHFG